MSFVFCYKALEDDEQREEKKDKVTDFLFTIYNILYHLLEIINTYVLLLCYWKLDGIFAKIACQSDLERIIKIQHM